MMKFSKLVVDKCYIVNEVRWTLSCLELITQIIYLNAELNVIFPSHGKKRQHEKLQMSRNKCVGIPVYKAEQKKKISILFKLF